MPKKSARKKSVLSRWRFWLLILVVVAGSGLAGSSEKAEKVSSDSVSKTDSIPEGENEESLYFEIGDAVQLDSLRYTIDSVKIVAPAAFDDTEGHIIRIAYTVENTGSTQRGAGLSDIKIYNDENMILEDYLFGSDNSFATLDAGRKAHLSQSFVSPETGDFEIVISPDYWSKAAAVFKVHLA